MNTDSKAHPNPLKKALDIGKTHRDVFDWPNAQEAFKKLKEEVLELEVELNSQNNTEKVFEEISDVFFTLLQIYRHLKLSPEKSLDFSNKKYLLRFKSMTENLKQDQKSIKALSDGELNSYWQKAKTETQAQLTNLIKKSFLK